MNEFRVERDPEVPGNIRVISEKTGETIALFNAPSIEAINGGLDAISNAIQAHLQEEKKKKGGVC